MDWKIAATLVICAGILAGAFFATSGPDVSGISGLFTAFSRQGNTNISFSASLAPQNFSFDAPADFMAVGWSVPGVQWNIGGSRLDLGQLSGNQIIVRGWNGRVSVTREGILDMDGTADNVTVNGMVITQNGRQSVKVSGLGTSSFAASGLNVQGLKFASASGTISVDGGRATFQAAGEPLEFGTFSGAIGTGTSLTISGNTDKLILSGNNKLSVSQ